MLRPVRTTADAAASVPVLVHSDDSPMTEIIRRCRRIAATEATVLLTGPTGTGKEVMARLIHELSQRSSNSLVPVNCAAIPETLLESELFGFVRGAFTGAQSPRRGRLAAADGGTLFLDEVGELPLALQAKLLRVLQERCYEPLGSTESVPANFRLVAATNRDLAAEVEAGRFRRDLYYRLLVCPIELPSLRERPTDVPMLFDYFWRRRGEQRPVDPAVFERLSHHDWPGNVRELENMVERLSVCVEGPVIRVEDLPEAIIPHAHAPAHVRASLAAADAHPSMRPAAPHWPRVDGEKLLPVDLPALLREIEDTYIDAALERANGSRKGASELLGLRRTTLVEKLRRRRPTPLAIAPDPAGGSVTELVSVVTSLEADHDHDHDQSESEA